MRLHMYTFSEGNNVCVYNSNFFSVQCFLSIELHTLQPLFLNYVVVAESNTSLLKGFVLLLQWW